MELHIYDREVSGCRVSALVTAALTIAVAIVMITREKIPSSASFFRIDIWTGHSMLMGIAMTVDLSILLLP